MENFETDSFQFEKIGLNESNKWIIYDEQYTKFFNWLTANIPDKNTLIDCEVLQINESKNFFTQKDSLTRKITAFENEFPNILEYSSKDILNLKMEIQNAKEIFGSYDYLVTQMQNSTYPLTYKLQKIECEIQNYKNKEDILLKHCKQKAKDLEELQKSNKIHCTNLNNSIIELDSPPLFAHQFSLEKYLLKCDSFIQHFALYLQKNFKFQNFIDLGTEQPKNDLVSLEKLKSLILYYSTKHGLSKSKLMGLQRMLKDQDKNKIKVINISNLKKEIQDLSTLNDISNNIYETLLGDLKLHLEQLAQQYIEFLSYQNTKKKIRRARQRTENLNFLSKIILKVLKNSELMWIMIQLDGEKINNHINNSENLSVESQKCCRRIECIKQIEILSLNINNNLVDKIKGILFRFLNSLKNSSNFSNKIYFKKLDMVLEQCLNDVNTNKNNVTLVLNNINKIEKNFLASVLDGPTNRLILHQKVFLESVLKFTIYRAKLEKMLRELRSDFHENISSRLNSDKLWKNLQLLWIWFLTEPKRIFNSLEEIRNVVCNTSTTENKALIGIKRQKF